MKDLLFWILTLSLAACTPKTGQNTQTETPTPPAAPDPNLSACAKFTDLPASQADQAETNYVLYRDYLKAGDLTKAYEYWQKVYQTAPAADGKRSTVFTDGIRFYENLARGESDSTAKAEYIALVMQLYDEMDKCYPEGGAVYARKAFDLFYNYPGAATKEEMYGLFKKSVDIDGINTRYFVLNPFTALLADLHFEGVVSVEEAKKYEGIIRQVLAKGLAECEGADCEPWNIINEYAPARLEAFEAVEGFYDCEYYASKYFAEFQAAPADCEVIRTVYSRLKFGKCPETDARFAQVIEAANKNCVEEKSLAKGYQALREARYRDAIALFEEAAANEPSADKKGEIYLLIAKVYYAHLKNFGNARSYARKASSVRPNWGQPYMLIGRLYASSGPLCGPGRGWDSQIVTWPAIDMWQTAKRVDPSVASEANALINRYTAYMPSREDIFQRTHKEGDSFFVGCWIQETTTIRAAPY